MIGILIALWSVVKNEQGAGNERRVITGEKMAKDVIRVDGEDRVVREDTAKSFRGVYWILATLGLVIVGALVLFFAFGLGSTLSGDKLESPATIENTTRR